MADEQKEAEQAAIAEQERHDREKDRARQKEEMDRKKAELRTMLAMKQERKDEYAKVRHSI